MSLVKNVVITGANRGLGFHILKAMLPTLKPNLVFATFRDSKKSKDLHALAEEHPSIVLVQLDVQEHDRYQDVANVIGEATRGKGINLLINNAGISSKVAKLSGTRREDLVQNFEINTVAPIMFTKALFPLLEKGAKLDASAEPGIKKAAVVNMSSILGSIAENNLGGMYPYRCSKAALNAATRSMSLDFKGSGIISVALHPGWVSTEMGGPKAPLKPNEAATQIVQFLSKLNSSHNGNFYQYDGKPVPW